MKNAPPAFDELHAVFASPVEGERVRRARKVLNARDAIIESGCVDDFRIIPQGTFLDAVDDAFSASARLTIPYLSRESRMFLVRYRDVEGEEQVMLFHPTDEERAASLPATSLSERLLHSRVAKALSKRLVQDVKTTLESLAIDPHEVTQVVYPTLMRQDLRGLLGSHDEVPLLPNARLWVPRVEWDRAHDPHPIQRAWYVQGGVDGIDEQKVEFIDSSTLLGAGIALLALGPDGTLSLAVVRDEKPRPVLYVVSDLAVATDCYSPLASEIKGLHESAQSFALEAIPRRSVRETPAGAYTAMIVEKTLAGAARDSNFCNVIPVSEIKKSGLIPSPNPTFCHDLS